MIKQGTCAGLCAALIMLCALPALTETAVFPGKIEFRGVINVSGQEIVRRAGVKRSGSGFAVDMDMLKKVLSGSEMIKDYTIGSENGNLVINVQERYPLFMFFVVDKELSVPVLVDDNMNAVVSGRFFDTDMPIIIVRRGEFDLRGDSREIQYLLENLKQMKAGKMPLSGELQEIEITGENTLRVSLRGRKTGFIIWNSMAGFRRLDRTAALLDQAGRYPDSLDLRKDLVLLK